MKIERYKDLEVWKKGMEIVQAVYENTQKFPEKEIYGLASHMRKTAISIPSNIAEGFARSHRKEFAQFCNVAIGSCAELETQVIIARRLDYIKAGKGDELEAMLDHESRMLRRLILSLDRKDS